MQARRKTREILARHDLNGGRVRVAAEMPAPQGDDQPLDHQTPDGMRRNIPNGYEYDPKALKPLAKMLWSMSVALGHALTANRQFTRLKSSTISPDGLLGGRGYVASVKDVRKALYDACEALSAISDTIHDEINAPHWKPKLALLEQEDAENVEKMVGDAERILEDPEGEAEEDLEEEEEAKSEAAPWHHPAVRKDNAKKGKPGGSKIPDGGDQETVPRSSGPRSQTTQNNEYDHRARQASTYSYGRTANSSLPVETMPGGPRVDHLDRGDTDQTGPFGTYNSDDDMELSDQWRRDDGFGSEYNYPSDFDNDLHEKQAAFKLDPAELAALKSAARKKGDHHLQQLAEALESGNWRLADQFYQMLRASRNLHDVPDGIVGELGRRDKYAAAAIPDGEMDATPTEGWDFGIGDGNGDDAHGQGAGGYGTANPGAPDDAPGTGVGNKGVYGPQSGLPSDPAGKKTDDSAGDPMAVTELEVGGRMPRLSYDRTGSATELPQDVSPVDVARADYFDGPKDDNMQNVAPSTVGSTALPGEELPAKDTPTKPRPAHNQEHMFGQGMLPGDESVTHEFDKDTGPETGYRYERVDQPYIKWDYTTPEMRPDPTYQRDVQGPFVHNDLTRASDG